jgi:ribosome-binding factor A
MTNASRFTGRSWSLPVTHRAVASPIEGFSMSSRRTAKVAEAIREQVSTAILFDLKDPRVKNVTVTRVEVSPDLRNAKVYVSVMGDEKAQRLSIRGLESARGFLQAKLAERVQIRYTPILQFRLDQGVKRSIETSRLLRELLPRPAENDEETLADAADAADESDVLDDQEDEDYSEVDDEDQPPGRSANSPSEPTLEIDEQDDRSKTKHQP